MLIFTSISNIQWLLCLLTTFGVVAVAWIIRYIVSRYLTQLTTRTTTEIDDTIVLAIKKTHLGLMLIIGAMLGAHWLDLPPNGALVCSTILKLALLIQIAIWVHVFLNAAITKLLFRNGQVDPVAKPGLRAISFLSRLVVWSLLLIFSLDNLGVNVSTMIAGLGIGGIALALALQSTLGDLFCFVAILLDKPFVIGDFVVVGDYLGTIEYIGIKTTRIRSLQGEQIIVSNNDLLSSRIRNYKRMEERRILFTISVVYNTAADAIERIPDLIRQIIESTSQTRFDRTHFARFGDFSLHFECVYYVLTSDYNEYMNIQQTINYAIFRKFEEERIEFAFPTQTVYVNSPAMVSHHTNPAT
jgi:small-conductance mechanosensitive channel